MKELLRVAARNLLRQRRRSALTGASIVLGVASALFVAGFMAGVVETLMRLTVEANLGAIQIHRRGYADAEVPLAYDLPEEDGLHDKVLGVANVAAMAPRINFDGLLNNGESASVILATAIAPDLEYAVCPGRQEQLGDRPLKDGEIIVGDELAESLGLSVGSVPTLLAATAHGQSNALDASVSGLLEIKIPIAAKMVGVVSLPFAQRLLRMPRRVTEYALSVNDLGRVDATARAVAAVVGPDFQVETWRQREPAAGVGLDRFSVVIGIIIAVLFLLVGSSVVNSMLMSVQERVREIGTMMAVGVTRRKVLFIVLAEAALLALIGASIGSVIGIALTEHYHHAGIVFQLKNARPLSVYPFASLRLLVQTILGAEIGTLLAALYPAFKASRLSPVEALRQV